MLSFCNELEHSYISDKVIIDFSRMQQIGPFGMLYVAKKIGEFTYTHEHVKLLFNNHQHHAYANYMGFFKAIGADPRKPLAHHACHTLLPITVIHTNRVINLAKQSKQSQSLILDKASFSLATQLGGDKGESVIPMLQFLISELMNNIFQHSGANNLAYCAQYWPATGRVEIGMLDTGVGVKHALSKNSPIAINDDSQAILQALSPFSWVADKKERRIRRSLGLYTTNRMCVRGGELFMGSGDQGVLVSEKGKTRVPLGHMVSGTAVKVALNAHKLGNWNVLLRSIRQESERFFSHLSLSRQKREPRKEVATVASKAAGSTL